MIEDERLIQLRALLRLGVPIMIAQTFQMGMGVTDTIMAGRYSTVDLAGVAIAGGMAAPIVILIMGTVIAISPVTAQLFGAGKYTEIGQVVRQGVWLALATSILGILLVKNLTPLFAVVKAEADVTVVALNYLRAIIWGYPAIALYFVFRHTCEGMGRTRPAMIVAGFALIVNVLMNYVFIYGRFGAPELGGAGCGVATAIVNWLQCAAMFLVVLRGRFYQTAKIFAVGWAPRIKELKRLARLGLPIGVTMFLEMGLFVLVTLLLAPFGANSVAAHSIATNINGVAFMIPLSLGVAASIRVGHCIGAGELAQARIVGSTAVQASLTFAAAMAVLFFLLRFEIVGVFTHNAEVIGIAANVLLFVAGYQFVDDTQVAAIGVLRGYKDTRVPMILAFIGYWVIALPVAILCGYGFGEFDGWGIYGFWVALVTGVAFVAITTNIRRVRLASNSQHIRRLASEGVTSL